MGATETTGLLGASGTGASFSNWSGKSKILTATVIFGIAACGVTLAVILARQPNSPLAPPTPAPPPPLPTVSCSELFGMNATIVSFKLEALFQAFSAEKEVITGQFCPIIIKNATVVQDAALKMADLAQGVTNVTSGLVFGDADVPHWIKRQLQTMTYQCFSTENPQALANLVSKWIINYPNGINLNSLQRGAYVCMQGGLQAAGAAGQFPGHDQL